MARLVAKPGVSKAKKASPRTSPGTSAGTHIAPPSPSVLLWCGRHPLICFMVLSVAWVLLLYGKVLDAPFVYDDLDGIVSNPSLTSWHSSFARFFLSPVSFSTAFLGKGGSMYRPVYWLTLAFDRHIWGIGDPSGFHFTNLLLHWLNGLLLFQILRRLQLPVRVAAAAATVWLGLPVNTEAVAWVSARAYLLSSFFLLAALLAAYSYLETKRWLSLALFAVLALGALLSHEQGLLLLPFTILLLLWRKERRSVVWVRIVGTSVLLSSLYWAAKHLVGSHAGQGGVPFRMVGLVFWHYLGLLLAPVRMSVERSTSLPVAASLTAAAMAWAGLLLLLAVASFLCRRAPVLAGGVLCGCVALLPYCGFVPIYQGMAERFAYLASMGFTVALVSAIASLPKPWRGPAIAGLLVWVLWGGWRLTTRVRDWDDPVQLYRTSLAATPGSPLLWYNLGYSLRERGDLADALRAYRDAVQLAPRYTEALASIGDINAQLGQPAEALRSYREALALEPNNPGFLINEAMVLEQTGDTPGAEQGFKHAIAAAPRDSAAYVDLGALYVQQSRLEDAIACFGKAIALNPDDANSFFDLAVLYQKTGRGEQARPLYQRVLQLKPGDPDTVLNLAKLGGSPSTP